MEDLQARVSVRTEIAGFVNINIGVDAHLDRVKLGIKGVEAQVLLKVKLERILGTLDRALSVLEQHPQLLDSRSREPDREPAQIEGSVADPDETPDEPESRDASAEATTAATTAARRKAEELGLDLSQVEGTGAGGRVLVRDVLQAAG